MKTIEEIWARALPYKPQQKPSEFFPFLEMVQKADPVSIVEIGSCYGGATMCFAHLADTVIAIDMPVNVDLPPVKELKGLCEFHYILSDSHKQEAFKQVKEILNGRDLGLLFIDGDHTAAGARQDFDMYSPLVRPGGMIAFHDIVDSPYHRSAFVMVASVYNELAQQYDHVEFVEPDGIDCGIGVLKTKDN